MSEEFGLGPYGREIREELIRVGLGQGGINIGGNFTPEQLLQALRSIPNGMGREMLLGSLEAIHRRNSGQ